MTDWALAQLGEFHGAASVVLARAEGGRGEMRIDHEWVAPGSGRPRSAAIPRSRWRSCSGITASPRSLAS